MKIILLVLLVLLFNSIELISHEIYDGRLFLKNNTIIEAERITISKDTVFYSDLNSTNSYNIPVNELNKLEIRNGTYKTLGLISGGFIGFTTYYLLSNNNLISFNGFETTEAVVYSAIGLILGGTIGELTNKTRDIFFSNQFSVNIFTRSYPLMLSNTNTYQVIYLSINL